jgi:hypothetical protein
MDHMNVSKHMYGKLIEIAPGVFEGSEPLDEAEHFYVCTHCGQAVHMRQLADVLYHDAPGHEPIARQ